MDSQKNKRYLVTFKAQFQKDVPGNPVAYTTETHESDVELSWNGYDVVGLRRVLETYARDTYEIKEYAKVNIVITFIFELKENPNGIKS